MIFNNPILLFALFLIIIYSIFRYLAGRKPKEEKWELQGVKVVLICQKCNKHWQKLYDPNYIIGQKIPKPCKCGGDIYVEKIYLESEKEKGKKDFSKYEELFR